MPFQKSKPIRMCIACRERFAQSSLVRLQCVEHSITAFQGQGRSFYLCLECAHSEKVDRVLVRQCRGGAKVQLLSQLKEIVSNVR
ncbi:MAG TPA: DUF448 domain-containing protein [Helicobacteraceae bacterium]|nr:DUF448 domain-containing protein [Helicobacteraceae bacterium]